MILDRVDGRIADLPYQNLCRPLAHPASAIALAEPWRINGNGGERRFGVSCVLHIVEASKPITASSWPARSPCSAGRSGLSLYVFIAERYTSMT
jgi:hypothetical protein